MPENEDSLLHHLRAIGTRVNDPGRSSRLYNYNLPSRLNTGDYVIAQFRLWLLPAIARLRRRIFTTSTHVPSREPSDRYQSPSSRTSPTNKPPTSNTSNYPMLDLTSPDSDIGWTERDALPSYQLSASFETTNQLQLYNLPSTLSHTIPYQPDTVITNPPQFQDPTTISPSSSCLLYTSPSPRD